VKKHGLVAVQIDYEVINFNCKIKNLLLEMCFGIVERFLAFDINAKACNNFICRLLHN